MAKIKNLVALPKSCQKMAEKAKMAKKHQKYQISAYIMAKWPKGRKKCQNMYLPENFLALMKLQEV